MASCAKDAVKREIMMSLNNILSSAADVRKDAEANMKVLQVTNDYGICLLEVALDDSISLALRQLAAVLLQQYVGVHWSQNCNKFSEPEVPSESKIIIRQMIPHGLFAPSSKIRSSIAYAVSNIATHDWPEAWPDLFDVIIKAIQSGNGAGVHGAMRVLSEISRDMDDKHIQKVAPVILPEVYNIFIQDQKYSIRTRGRAVEIFTSVVKTVCMLGEYNKNLAKTLIYPSLPPFTTALLKYLQMHDCASTDAGLKKDILKALITLVTNVPRQMTEYLPDVLSYVWNTMISSAEIYQKTTVNGTEETDDPTDSDGEILGFECLVFNLFEFVTALLRTSKHKDMIKQVVPDLMYYLILYMQLTREQLEIFTDNVDSFVEFEDEESYTFSVRSAAQELLKSLQFDLTELFCVGLTSAVQKHIQNAESLKNAGDPAWWKPIESVLMAVGLASNILLKKGHNNGTFDVKNFVDAVIRPNLDPNLPAFLVGRAIWCGSELGKALDASFLHSLLQICSEALQPNTNPIIKVSVIRSLNCFLTVFDVQENTSKRENTLPIALLKPFYDSIVEGLVYSTAQSSTEVMGVALDTLNIAVSLDPAMTAPHLNKVSSLCLAIFIKHSHDLVLISLVREILRELCTHPQAAQLIQDKFLPTLTNLLNASSDSVSAALQAVSLDILSVLIRAQPPTSVQSPLIQTVLPAVFKRTTSSDDLATQQNGSECLRAYVSTSADIVAQWNGIDGKSGIDCMVTVCDQFLALGIDDSSAIFIGRLITSLIRHASVHLREKLQHLLTRVLVKLNCAENLKLTENLIMVYAHLIHSDLNSILEFFYSFPGPDGEYCINFIMKLWCLKQTDFYGSYERKVTSLALAKLLEHAVINNDTRFQEIITAGDKIISSSGVRTRSRSEPERWTQIPLLTKLFKLLVDELASAMEASATRDDYDDDDYEDEGWEDDEANTEGDAESDKGAIFTSDLLNDDFTGDLVDESDDPDAVADPLNSIQLLPYLTNFVKTFSQHPAYSLFTDHLNEQQRETLTAIGVPTPATGAS